MYVSHEHHEETTEFSLVYLDTLSRHIFVICNPYSGAKRSRYTYNTKVKPLLDRVKYKVTYAGKSLTK